MSNRRKMYRVKDRKTMIICSNCGAWTYGVKGAKRYVCSMRTCGAPMVVGTTEEFFDIVQQPRELRVKFLKLRAIGGLNQGVK